jgi:hypothetical protein
MEHFTTPSIQDIINRRVETGLADLLLSIYHAAYCAGANLPTEAPEGTYTRDLLSTLAGRHRVEILAPRGLLDEPATNDELPGWLLAHCERQVALGDAQPPDGWGAEGWPV